MKKTHGNLKTVLIALLSLILVFSVVFATVAVAEPEQPTERNVVEVTTDGTQLKVALDVSRLEDLRPNDLTALKSELVSQLKSLIIDQMLSTAEPINVQPHSVFKLGAPQIPEPGEGEDLQSVLGRYKDKLEERLKQEGELEKYLGGEYDIVIKEAVAEYLERNPDVAPEEVEKVVEEVNEVVEDVIVDKRVEEIKDLPGNEGKSPEQLKEELKEALDALEPGQDVTEVLGSNYGEMFDRNTSKKEELTETVQDIVENGAPALTIGDILSALRKVVVGGHVIYDEAGAWNAHGVKGLVSDLFNKVKAVEDEFVISYDVHIGLSFGDAEFTAVVELVNYNGSVVQTAVNYVKDHVDFGKVDGVWTLNVRVPDVHTQLLNLVVNELDEKSQHELFTLTDMTFADALARVKELGKDFFLDVAKDVDYNALFSKVLDADWLATQSNGRLSATTAQRYIDAVLNRGLNLVKKVASKQTVKDVEKVLQEYGISGIPQRLEGATQVVLNELHELNVTEWKREDLVNFLTTEANDEMIKVLNRLERSGQVEDVFETLINYAERGLKLNFFDQFRDGTLAGIVQNGQLSWSGTVSFVASEYDSVLTRGVRKIASVLGLETYTLEDIVGWITDNVVYEDVAVSVSATLPGISNVSYKTDGNTVRGLLPDGADVSTFAPTVEGKDGAEIVAWLNDVDEQVTEVNGDVALHAVTKFHAVIRDVDGANLQDEGNNNYSKVYDGTNVTLYATVETYGEGHNAKGYTYQWYKGDGAIEGATESYYVIPADAGSGEYYCKVTSVVLASIKSDDQTVTTDTVSVKITQQEIEFNAEWDYDSAFTYDATEHIVSLTNLNDLQAIVGPQGQKWDFDGDLRATDAGTYDVGIVFISQNYVFKGNVQLSWTIKPAEVTPKLEQDNFKYEAGRSYTVHLDSETTALLNKLVGVNKWELTGDVTKSEKGDDYKAIIKFKVDTQNVTLTTSVLTWKITDDGSDEPDKPPINPDGEKGQQFTFEVDGTTVTVVDVLGALPKTAKLAGAPVTYNIAYFEDLLEQNNLNVDSTILQVLDIHFVDHENVEGEFRVTLSNSDKFGDLKTEDLVLVHIHNGRNIVEATVENGVITFTVSNFSEFAVLSQSTTDQLATWWIWVLLAVIIILNIVIIILLLRRNGQGDDTTTETTEEVATEATDDVAEESAETEEVVEEEHVEETEPVEEVVEEPVVDEVPTETEVVPVVVTGEDEGSADIVLGSRDVLDRSFTAKLSQADDKLKALYSDLKNELLSYKKVRSRVSWKFDSFYKGRAKCVILQIRGKKLNMYIALRAEDLAPKYHAKDVSNKACYANTPTLVKVSGSRSLKYAKQLIALLMDRMGVQRGKEQNVNYRMRHRSTKSLLRDGFIKIKTVNERFGRTETTETTETTTETADTVATEATTTVDTEVATETVETTTTETADTSTTETVGTEESKKDDDK